MKNRSLNIWLRILPAAFALLVAGCGGGNADSSSKKAQMRLLNVSSDYDSVDLYSNNGDQESDTKQVSGVTTGTISPYVQLKGDTYTLKFRKTGTTGDLLSKSTEIASGTHTTFVSYGITGGFAVAAIDEDIDAPESGSTKVQVLNTAGAEAFDVYLTGANDALADVSAAVSGVAAGATSSAVSVSSGDRRLRVTLTGKKTDLRLNVPTISLPSAGVVTIILTRSTGGVLVNAVVLPKQGQPTAYDNTATARIRVLNVTSSYDSLDVYSSSDGSDTDNQLFGGIARGTATAYAALKADTYTLKFRKSGAAGNLLATQTTLVEDKHVTYVAYGSSSRFGVLSIDDETELPNTSYAKLQVFNATTADSLDVYLTGTADALTDVSPAISAVAAGSSSGFTTLRSGSYRLRITSATSKTDVRLDVPALSLDSTGVVSLILTEAAGGVLVSAVSLPQQGAPIRFDNNTVRVRGAVGLASGALATVSVAGTEIVTRRAARSFIADTYTTFASGTVPVIVTVDGVVVISGTVTLEAGRDYTLLAWDGGGAAQASLIADDNHASASHRAKLRLINGLSGTAVPLTLAVNYSPVSEYIEAGAASASTEIDAGTDNRLDVTNAQTLATLLSRDSITFVADGVYTFFVAGGGSNAITATLRKDR